MKRHIPVGIYIIKLLIIKRYRNSAAEDSIPSIDTIVCILLPLHTILTINIVIFRHAATSIGKRTRIIPINDDANGMVSLPLGIEEQTP